MSWLVATLLCASSDGGVLFTLTERTEGGRLLTYPEASLVDVDVNSDVDIIVNRDLLRTASARRVSTALEARATELRTILEAYETALKQVYEAQRAATDTTAAFQQLASANDAVRAYLDRQYGVPKRRELLLAAKEKVGIDNMAAGAIAKEIEQVTAEIDAHGADAGFATLEISAFVGSAQVHLPGYDALTPGTAVFVEKTKFVFDEGFQAEVDAAQALARSSADYNELVHNLRDQFLAQLRNTASTTGGLLDAATKLADDVRNDPALADAVSPVQDLVTALQTLEVRINEVIATVNGSETDPAKQLANIVGGAQATVTQAQVAITAAEKAFNAVKAIPAAIGTYTPRVTALLESLKPLLRLTDGAKAGSLPEVTASTPQPVNEAQNTTLSLPRTPREEDDLVTIRAVVRKPDGTILAGYEHERILRVRARGIVFATGAALMLARCVCNAPDSQSPGNFVPSGGAYAVVRWKGFRCGGDTGSPFLHALAPGVGIAIIAIPRSEDGTTRLVYMATAQIFEDLLQIGIGVDLRGQVYWGFGIGLHKLGLGKAFP